MVRQREILALTAGPRARQVPRSGKIARLTDPRAAERQVAMIAHLVLFKPRGDVGPADRQALIDAIVRSRREIPGIRRFELGRRVLRDASYASAMPEDFSYAAVIEFENLEALQAYLQHPTHDSMGTWFWKVSEATLVYDYELTDAANAPAILGSTPVSSGGSPSSSS